MPTPNDFVINFARTFIAEFVTSGESEGFLQMPLYGTDSTFERLKKRSLESFVAYAHCFGCRKEWEADWIKVYCVGAVCGAYLDITNHFTGVDASFDRARKHSIVKKIYELVDPALLFCNSASQTNCSASTSPEAMRKCWLQFLDRLIDDMRDVRRRLPGLCQAEYVKQQYEQQDGSVIGPSFASYMSQLYRHCQPIVDNKSTSLNLKVLQLCKTLCAAFNFERELEIVAEEYAQRYLECFTDQAAQEQSADLPYLFAAAAIDCCRNREQLVDSNDKDVLAVYISLAKFSLEEIKAVRGQMLKRPVDPSISVMSLAESSHVTRFASEKARSLVLEGYAADGAVASSKEGVGNKKTASKQLRSTVVPTLKQYWASFIENFRNFAVTA